MPKCPSGKKRFTEHAAQRVVVNAKIGKALHGNQKRREERAYWCHLCGAWHVTSQAARPA